MALLPSAQGGATSCNGRRQVRLKEALDRKRPKAPPSMLRPASMVEYVFGICEPDGRTGKQGSR